MRFGKRIVATIVAVVISIGTTISASALDKGWTLHYNTSYPTNANRYLDKIEFFYNGSSINTYNDYLYHFNYTQNTNGSVPYVEFYGYVINQDGSGYNGVEFSNQFYYANNGTDNNSSVGRLHPNSPFSLSHPVTVSKELVVFHSLKNVTKNVQINGKGVV